MRVLLIGDEQATGYDRDAGHSMHELVERLPDARAVVVSRSGVSTSARVRAVRSRKHPLLLRLAALTRIIRDEAQHAEIVDVHVALYAFLPLALGMLRGKTIVVRFDGPATDEDLERAMTTRRWSLGRAFERYVYRRAALTITTTGASRRTLIEQYRVSPWRVKTEYPSDLPGRFGQGDRRATRERLSLPREAFVACYLKAPVPPPEARLLLEAWSDLLAARGVAGETRPVHLLLASAGEARGALSATEVPSALSDSVTVLGRLDGDDIANLFLAADVNVATSSSGRADAIALAAAACGTPSITPDPELFGGVADLDATLVVPPDDPGALGRRLASAASGALPDQQLTLAWATRRQWDRIVAQRRQLYDDLVPERPDGARKIRVAYVGHVAKLSGGEIALARLVDALVDVDAHVILAEDGPLVKHLHASDVSVEVLPLRERTRDLRRDRVRPAGLPATALFDTALYVLRLARRIHAIRPDLVHTNTLKAGIYGCLAARLAGVPVVWHVRDRIASDYLRRSTVVLLRGLIATLPDSVIVNSEATRQTLWRTRERARAIHSPIPDPVSWRPVERRVGDHRFVVGMIGRIAPWKGQHVLLEAFAKAFAGGSEIAIIVGAAMFGGAEAEYEAGLRELAQSLGVSGRIIFRGFRSDVWRELVEMDIFVHASTTPEPFGQVIVEAMLAGTPVIATAGGGPSEILTDGIDGLLYPPGDVDALAAALRQLRHNPVLRERLADNGRRRATAFSPENAASAVMAVYRRMLQSREEAPV